MCKHKSGGMSKPSEAGSQRSGLDERSTASFSSHNCSQEINGASISQVHNSGNASSDASYNTQIRNFTTVPVISNTDSSNCSSSDTHKFFTKDENERCIPKLKHENVSYMPSLLQDVNEPEYSDFQDSDGDDSEQSPMLINQGCTVYRSSSNSWKPNIFPETEFNNIIKTDYFNPCDSHLCPTYQIQEPNDINKGCDNFPLYNDFQAQNTFQKPIAYILPPINNDIDCTKFIGDPINNFSDSNLSELEQYNYSSKSRKKWFLNLKCKSADSEPISHDRHISSIYQRGLSFEYNYDVAQSLMLEPEHYEKTNYSNNDPVAGPSGIQRPNSINWEIGTCENRNDEFRSRSYSLTPNVNFAGVIESESSSEIEDIQEPTIITETVDMPIVKSELCPKSIDEPYEIPILSLGKVIPISSSAAQLSIASSYGDNGSPICKICHMTAKENDPLISPCRCSGTMQYIHCGCLMRWLEVCNKRSRKPASCELCQYQYHWHKKFKIRHWQLPQCSRKDKILHLLFFLSLMLMVTCASITVLCFKQDKGTKVDPDRTELTQSEIVTLICGVLFFLAFFVAMYVEVKSHNTLYQLLVKFIRINQQWYIDEYEKKEAAPVAV